MNISVVIPLYNKEQYIGRTIESVLKQTVQPDDIVVVDDGSIDDSANKVMQFNDNRIRLIRQQNSGEGAARNRGVVESKNELVAFLDADDEWKPDFLLHIQRLCTNFPDSGAYATAYDVLEPNGGISYPILKGLPPAPWIGVLPYFFEMLQYGAPFSPSSVAIPRTVYRDLKGFPEGIKQGGDKMMWVRLGMKYPIAYSPSRQVVYHGEAENRASTSYEQEPATANLIDSLLLNKEVPIDIIPSITDYNAYLKIQKARHRVKVGHSKSARELLGTIKNNKKYHNQIIWWYFWSLVPYSLIRIVQRRQYIFI
jgi:glycosyltransferase involved in cell wall biosynthesis